MTYAELYKQVCEQLQAAGCEDAAFDAACLLADIGGLARGVAPGAVQEEVSAAALEAVCKAADERAGGRPLQYILGSWDFLMLTLSVGEGVLIPRPDTELLCETAAEYVRAAGWEACRMLDLCSGSGCVALGTAALLEGRSRVSAEAVELSPQAGAYLQRNIDRYPQYDVRAVCADVLCDAARFEKDAYQLLLSNPPYIPSADLPALQREVQREPVMALDGGDGYVFYRVIAAQWLDRLSSGGLCAVEVGIGQAGEVAAMLRQAGLREVRVLRDLGGVDRVVCGVK